MIQTEEALKVLRRSNKGLLHTEIVKIVFSSAQYTIFLVLILYDHELSKNLANSGQVLRILK